MSFQVEIPSSLNDYPRLQASYSVDYLKYMTRSRSNEKSQERIALYSAVGIAALAVLGCVFFAAYVPIASLNVMEVTTMFAAFSPSLFAAITAVVDRFSSISQAEDIRKNRDAIKHHLDVLYQLRADCEKARIKIGFGEGELDPIFYDDSPGSSQLRDRRGDVWSMTANMERDVLGLLEGLVGN